MTSLIRWSAQPARNLLGIRDDLDRLFDSLVPGSFGQNGFGTISPPVDIEETQDEFVVRADLPGLNQKDVKVTLFGDTLTIRGERKAQEDKKERGVHRVERTYGSFERSFRLGVPVRNDQVKASYRDGVLEIHVPKAEEAKVREIEVQVAS